MVDKIFERFPNIRLASVENGSEFLGDLFKKMPRASRKMPGYFGTDPVELFRRNVWINPFWEDDVREIADPMGADRVIFGSDWPHIEGMEHPLDYVAELKVFSDEDAQRLVMHDNTAVLNTPQPLYHADHSGLKPSNIRRIAKLASAPAMGVVGESRISAAPAAIASIVASRSTRPAASASSTRA